MRASNVRDIRRAPSFRGRLPLRERLEVAATLVALADAVGVVAAYLGLLAVGDALIAVVGL